MSLCESCVLLHFPSALSLPSQQSALSLQPQSPPARWISDLYLFSTKGLPSHRKEDRCNSPMYVLEMRSINSVWAVAVWFPTMRTMTPSSSSPHATIGMVMLT